MVQILWQFLGYPLQTRIIRWLLLILKRNLERDSIIEMLYAKLQHLSVSSTKLIDIKYTHDACHHTFMTDKLAKKLQLSRQYKEALSVSTFAARKSQDVSTYVDLATKDGASLPLQAKVIDQITGPIYRGPLQSSHLDFYYQFQLKRWLREWMSNSAKLIDLLPKAEISAGNIWETFGITNVTSYRLIELVFMIIMLYQLRKREVLTTVAKIVDPLGLLTSVIFSGKVFLQELWRVDVSWDEPLNVELAKKWCDIVQALSSITTLKIPCYVSIVVDNLSCDLFIFCDASIKAMLLLFISAFRVKMMFKLTLCFQK